jgi:hypothetical protein
VPVRGRVLGTECLPEVLGDVAVSESPHPWRRMRSSADRLAGAFLIVAALATLLPWTRFSTGSGFAGAWAFDRRWSMLAAVGATIGLGVWLAFGAHAPVARLAAMIGGAVVATGSLFAILNPPPFTKPALAPWITAVVGAGALVIGATPGTRSSTPRV